MIRGLYDAWWSGLQLSWGTCCGPDVIRGLYDAWDALGSGVHVVVLI